MRRLHDIKHEKKKFSWSDLPDPIMFDRILTSLDNYNAALRNTNINFQQLRDMYITPTTTNGNVYVGLDTSYVGSTTDWNFNIDYNFNLANYNERVRLPIPPITLTGNANDV